MCRRFGPGLRSEQFPEGPGPPFWLHFGDLWPTFGHLGRPSLPLGPLLARSREEPKNGHVSRGGPAGLSMGGGLLGVTGRNGRRPTFKKESLSEGANTPGTKAKPEAQGCRFEPGAQKPDESS